MVETAGSQESAFQNKKPIAYKNYHEIRSLIFPRLSIVIRKSASTPKFTYIDLENAQSKQDSQQEIKSVENVDAN